MRLERLGRPGKVKVIEARNPKAKCSSSEHDRPTIALGVSKRPDLGVGLQPGVNELRDKLTCGPLYAPIIDTDSNIKQPGIATGKVKIDDAAHVRLLMGAGKQDIIAKQIAVGWAIRNSLPDMSIASRDLLIQGALKQ